MCVLVSCVLMGKASVFVVEGGSNDVSQVRAFFQVERIIQSTMIIFRRHARSHDNNRFFNNSERIF